MVLVPEPRPTATPSVPKTTDEVLRDALANQYHAALRMLKLAIELCPDDLWYLRPDDGVDEEGEVSAGTDARSFWRTAYHALFYTHLYLELRDDSLDSAQLHQTGIQDIGEVPLPPDLEDDSEAPHWPPHAHTPLTKAQVLEYWLACDSMVDPTIAELDLVAIDDGFHWDNPPLPRLVQQVDAIRHLQHHTSQLCGRLEFLGGGRIEWVSACQPRVLDALERLDAEGV